MNSGIILRCLGSRCSRCSHCCLLISSSFLFFFRTLFEEYFPQYFFFLFIWVIIFNIIITRLIKYKVIVMITIRILISYSPSLGHTLRTRSSWTSHGIGWSSIGHCRGSNVWSEKQYSLMESTNNRYFQRLFLSRLLNNLFIIFDEIINLILILLGSITIRTIFILLLFKWFLLIDFMHLRNHIHMVDMFLNLRSIDWRLAIIQTQISVISNCCLIAII